MHTPTNIQINAMEKNDTMGLNLISPTSGALNLTHKLLSSLKPKSKVQ